jgi:hypothetical protein
MVAQIFYISTLKTEGRALTHQTPQFQVIPETTSIQSRKKICNFHYQNKSYLNKSHASFKRPPSVDSSSQAPDGNKNTQLMVRCYRANLYQSISPLKSIRHRLQICSQRQHNQTLTCKQTDSHKLRVLLDATYKRIGKKFVEEDH